MTAVVADPKDLFLDLFEQSDRAHAGGRYTAQRRAGRDRFRALPLPGPRTEDWRFTSIASLLKVPFALPPADARADGVDLPPLPTPDTLRLVFVNGRFQPGLSALADVPGGVTVGSLAAVPEGSVPAGTLGGVADYEDNAFTALNTGLLHDGAFLSVADGVALERPIEILYVTASGGRPVVTHPRTLLVLGRNAQATVVERFLAAAEDEVYLTNAVAEVVLSESAIVDHYKVQDESRRAFHVANTQVVQAGRSTFSTHYIGFGGALARNEVRVRFEAEGCEATVNGLYVGSAAQHLDNFTVIDHAKAHCNSHELYKGILDDRAHGVFNGKIFVREDAQKTDAKQTNQVLLLSDGATINTKPQLEIFADDVKCTHGATVGQLSEDQLFYLRSRGIDRAAARSLLTFAFANDIVGRIKIEAIRDALEARLVRRNSP